MFVSFDFDHDPMTLVVKFDIDIVKMDLSTENEVPSFSGSKLLPESTHSQTGR